MEELDRTLEQASAAVNVNKSDRKKVKVDTEVSGVRRKWTSAATPIIHFNNGVEFACSHCCNIFGSKYAFTNHACVQNGVKNVCDVCGVLATREHINSLGCFQSKPKHIVLLNNKDFGYKPRHQLRTTDEAAAEVATSGETRELARKEFKVTAVTMGVSLLQSTKDNRPDQNEYYDSVINYARHVCEMMKYFTNSVIPCKAHFKDMQARFHFHPAVFFAWIKVIGGPQPDSRKICECGGETFGFSKDMDYYDAFANLRKFAYVEDVYKYTPMRNLPFDEATNLAALQEEIRPVNMLFLINKILKVNKLNAEMTVAFILQRYRMLNALYHDWVKSGDENKFVNTSDLDLHYRLALVVDKNELLLGTNDDKNAVYQDCEKHLGKIHIMIIHKTKRTCYAFSLAKTAQNKLVMVHIPAGHAILTTDKFSSVEVDYYLDTVVQPYPVPGNNTKIENMDID